MGEKTKIGWCAYQMPDGRTIPGDTFNAWIGCTKVSQGCKLCYAESQNKRYNWNPDGWGVGAPRKVTSTANWNKPLQWAKEAVKAGVTRRVFCASLADVFDPEVDHNIRLQLWDLIQQSGEEIGGLEWLLLTKRIENAADMLPVEWLENPPDYIRLGVTTEDQENANKRTPDLFDVWSGKNFISYEPALGPLRLNDVGGWRDPAYWWGKTLRYDWVICGGESGAGCRPMDLAWARDVHHQCELAKVPFFMKQLGGFPDKQDDPENWPEDLRVREFPEMGER
jgi:protein gp37